MNLSQKTGHTNLNMLHILSETIQQDNLSSSMNPAHKKSHAFFQFKQILLIPG